MKRQHSSHAAAHAGAESCIALIDARFLAWLQGQTDSAQDHVRPQLHALLGHALAHNGLDLNLRRIYWYSDSADEQAVAGQISRAVLPHSQDGGLSMLRTLGADLKRLAERGACDHLLVGSDDERLISLIDEAQLHGVSVHLLADEASRNLEQLRKDDPEWADLLCQADSRLLLNEHAIRDLSQPRFGKGVRQVPSEDIESIRPILAEVVQAWWSEEPEDLREDLREELQVSRGIPQEIDRQMLLQVRKALDRTLSFQEKKLLRDMVRATVLGENTEVSSAA